MKCQQVRIRRRWEPEPEFAKAAVEPKFTAACQNTSVGFGVKCDDDTKFVHCVKAG